MLTTVQAAAKANRTVATIRHWCRYGAVTARKIAGRWVISATSLARRITIGRRRGQTTTSAERIYACGHTLVPSPNEAPELLKRPCWRCQAAAKSRAERERRRAVIATYGSGRPASKAQRRYLADLIRKTPQPPEGCPTLDILDVLPARAASEWIDRLKAARPTRRRYRCECASGRYGGVCTCC